MKHIIPTLTLALWLSGCIDTQESAQQDFDASHALAIQRYAEALKKVQEWTHRILECMGNHNEKRNTRSEGIFIRFLEERNHPWQSIQVNGYTHSPRREVDFHELVRTTWSIERPDKILKTPTDPIIPQEKFCKEVK